MLGGRQRAVLLGCFMLGGGLICLVELHGAAAPRLSRWSAAAAGPLTAVESPPRARAGIPYPVAAAAERHGLDPALVHALILTESGHNALAVSEKGAVGLMQVLPETAAWLGFPEAADPASNLDAGCQYLAALLDHFGGDVELALAGYNAGPGAVRRWGGVPPYRETTAFVARVAGHYERMTGLSIETATPLGR